MSSQPVLVHLHRARQLIELKRYASARREAKEYLRHEPTDVRAFVLLAQSYRLDGEYEPALEAARTGMALSPEHSSILFERVAALLALERPEEARPYLASLLERDQRNGILLAMKLEVAVGKLVDAERYARRGLQIDPESHQWHYILGYLHWRRGDHAAALRFSQTAVRLTPHSRFTQMNYHTTQWLNGQHEAAAAGFADVLRQFPADETAMRAYLHTKRTSWRSEWSTVVWLGRSIAYLSVLFGALCLFGQEAIGIPGLKRLGPYLADLRVAVGVQIVLVVLILTQRARGTRFDDPILTGIVRFHQNETYTRALYRWLGPAVVLWLISWWVPIREGQWLLCVWLLGWLPLRLAYLDLRRRDLLLTRGYNDAPMFFLGLVLLISLRWTLLLSLVPPIFVLTPRNYWLYFTDTNALERWEPKLYY